MRFIILSRIKLPCKCHSMVCVRALWKIKCYWCQNYANLSVAKKVICVKNLYPQFYFYKNPLHSHDFKIGKYSVRRWWKIYLFFTWNPILKKKLCNCFSSLTIILYFDHVINRKMMKSVRKWMNRNFVFFGNFGFTVFGYRWFTSRSQFDFQKFYKKLKISFFSKTTISCRRAASPEYFTTIHSATTFHHHLIFTVKTTMALES